MYQGIEERCTFMAFGVHRQNPLVRPCVRSPVRRTTVFARDIRCRMVLMQIRKFTSRVGGKRFDVILKTNKCLNNCCIIVGNML